MKTLLLLLALNDTTSARLLIRNCNACQLVIQKGKVVTDKDCNVVAYLDSRNRVIKPKYVRDYSLIK